MKLDERGRRAAEALRDRVNDDLPAAHMLASVQRTRTRRRLAMFAPAAALVVALAASLTTTAGHLSAGPAVPGPTSPASSPAEGVHANGVLFGAGNQVLEHPPGLHVPPLGDGSSPTWSPDGSEVAVLAGGILITDVHSGQTRRLPCQACSEIAWSPDGGSFAATRVGQDGSSLWLVDASTGGSRPVALDGIRGLRSLTWAPDSRTLAFLATSPAANQGGWTVRTEGSRPQQFLDFPTTPPNDPAGRSALQVRWSPTSPSLAVLVATPNNYRHSPAPHRLDVMTMHPDGATTNHLVAAGPCACVGFTPNLVWSPDGRTLGVSSLGRSSVVNRLDGDGATVLVRFLPGASGPLSWQPLPAGP
jgi:hypothetical protein